MVRTKLLCLEEIVFKWYHNRAKWNIFTDKHRLRAVSHFFYCSQSSTNNNQFCVNIQDLLSYNLIKHRDGHKEQNIGQPETRIMKAIIMTNNCQNAQRIVFTKTSALSLKPIKRLHSRRYMFLRKRRSFEYRQEWLARIAIALNGCSVYGQIQYTKPLPLCLLNKLLQLVLV